MSNDVELSAGRRSPNVFRSLAAQAGMSWSEFLSLAGADGDMEAAVRAAAGRVERRRAGRRPAPARMAAMRHLVEVVANAPTLGP